MNSDQFWARWYIERGWLDEQPMLDELMAEKDESGK